MIEFCPRCKNEVVIPLFTKNEKEQLLEMIRQGQPLKAIKILHDTKNLDLKQGKCFVDHVVLIKGKCHRCSFSKISKEIQSCEKCKCLNINW